MKAATKEGIQTILDNVTNKDVYETLQAHSELEDTIFQKLERIQILSSMQCQLDASDPPVDLPNRIHYSQLLDEQIKELRHLLDSYVG